MEIRVRCPLEHVRDVAIERGTPMGDVPCPECGLHVERIFQADALPQIGVDAFRSYHLSTAKERVQVEQQRYVQAPEDRPTARAMEKAQGIKYVGNETGGMTRNAQKAVAQWQERKKDGQRV